MGGNVYLLNVSDKPGFSDLVEQRTGIRHESPQVIVLKSGQPAWHASHYAITRDAIAKALAGEPEAAAPPTE